MAPRNTETSDRLTYATAAEFHQEIARLQALIESLRVTVREQRREIAGLREERRAILEADRPQMDRRLAALEQLAALDEELGLPRTPNPHATPAEGTLPPECTDAGGK